MGEQLNAGIFLDMLAQECRIAQTTDFDTLWEISRKARRYLRSFSLEEQAEILEVIKQYLERSSVAEGIFLEGSLEADCFVRLLSLVYNPPPLI